MAHDFRLLNPQTPLPTPTHTTGIQVLKIRMSRIDISTEEKVVNFSAAVCSWLDQLGIQEGANSKLECLELQDEGRKKTKATPSTPIRRPLLLPDYDEISPTDTKFSNNSIFDSPVNAPDSGLDKPSPTDQRARDKTEYADTEASTVCDYDEDQDKGIEEEHRYPVALFATLSEKRNPIQTSHDPLPDHEDDDLSAYTRKTHLITRILPLTSPLSLQESTSISFHGHSQLDTHTPQLVWITSCLQCVLANLPCSRTPPACSRCKRSKRAEICLLHRRRLRSETVDGNDGLNITPVLLQLEGDDEVNRSRKIELAEELMRAWLDNDDKRNWVLPRIDCDMRRGWNMHRVRSRRNHPGEGIGRPTYRELRLG